MIDPSELSQMNLEQLVEAYNNAGEEEEQIVAERVAIREAILPLIPDDGTVVGEYTVSKVKRKKMALPTKAKEKREAMDRLRELGLIKTVEQVDMKAAEQMHEKGVKLPFEFSYSISPMIRRIQQEEKE